MQWSDDAIVLSSRPFGEGSRLAVLLTRDHGKHAGLVRGARKLAGGLQPGSLVTAIWRARLDDHLGQYTLETSAIPAAGLMHDPVRLLALQAACAVAEAALPDRQPHPGVYAGLMALLTALGGDHWAASYVGWELGVLASLGFGLDLSRCAATGGNDMLVYVSPRSGRAVSAAAGAPYADRMLALPGFLVGQGEDTPEAVRDGIALAGYFLERHALTAGGLPPSRLRLAELLGRGAPPLAAANEIV